MLIGALSIFFFLLKKTNMLKCLHKAPLKEPKLDKRDRNYVNYMGLQ